MKTCTAILNHYNHLKKKTKKTCNDYLASDKFPTGRRYGVHYGAKLPFPLLRQAGLAERLKMCLHWGVHRQEVALKKATECGGSHFSHLENKASYGHGHLNITKLTNQ